MTLPDDSYRPSDETNAAQHTRRASQFAAGHLPRRDRDRRCSTSDAKRGCRLSHAMGDPSVAFTSTVFFPVSGGRRPGERRDERSGIRDSGFEDAGPDDMDEPRNGDGDGKRHTLGVIWRTTDFEISLATKASLFLDPSTLSPEMKIPAVRTFWTCDSRSIAGLVCVTELLSAANTLHRCGRRGCPMTALTASGIPPSPREFASLENVISLVNLSYSCHSLPSHSPHVVRSAPSPVLTSRHKHPPLIPALLPNPLHHKRDRTPAPDPNHPMLGPDVPVDRGVRGESFGGFYRCEGGHLGAVDESGQVGRGHGWGERVIW